MDLGLTFNNWFLSFGFILGTVGMVGLIGGAVTALLVPADHPALRPPCDSDAQSELPLEERKPASQGLLFL